MKTKTLMTLALTGALVAGATVVQANPELELISGATTVIVTQATAVGLITFSGAIGQWNLNVSTGVNAFGGPTLPSIDLNSVDGSAGGKPLLPLTVEYTAGGYTVPGVDVGTIGGTTSTSVTDWQWLGYSAFDMSKLLVKLGPFVGTGGLPPTAFSGSGLGDTGPIAGPYWLTEEVVIGGAGSRTKASGAQLTSFDANSTVPDGGLTMALFGSALAGLGAIRSRFGAKRA